MPRSSLEDPLKTHKFRVEVDGFQRAGFMAASGLEAETEVISYREGGDNDQPRLTAGMTKFTPITLKRGLLDKSRAGSRDMFTWHTDVHGVGANGRQQRDYRRDIDIVMLNRDGSVGVRWRVFNAWPSKYKTSDLDAMQTNEHIIEEIELQHEGCIRIL